MYKITWDKETGGVLLHSRIVEGTLVKQGDGFTSVPVSLVCVSHAFSDATCDLTNGIPQGLKKIESNDNFFFPCLPLFYFYKFACKIVKQVEHSPIHKTKTVHQSWCR